MTPQYERRDRRWTDERLDDLAEQVKANTARIEAFADIRADLVGIRSNVVDAHGDARDALAELRQLKADMEKRATEQHKERKADRKWMIGTVLATATLVVAALAVFLG